MTEEPQIGDLVAWQWHDTGEVIIGIIIDTKADTLMPYKVAWCDNSPTDNWTYMGIKQMKDYLKDIVGDK